jgi:hypothetical protein
MFHLCLYTFWEHLQTLRNSTLSEFETQMKPWAPKRIKLFHKNVSIADVETFKAFAYLKNVPNVLLDHPKLFVDYRQLLIYWH